MSTEEGRRVNGLDLTGFEEALRTIGETPGAQRAPKKSRTRWRGGFKFDALVRNHTFRVDEPSHLTGADEAPNSMEYVLGALGACLATGFVLNASRQGIEIYDMEVVLDASQDNVFTFLGLGGEGHSGFDGIKAKLFVKSDEDEATLRRLWEDTIKTSPVGNSMVNAVPIHAEIGVVG
jgi:uncharacterized OsmC-like protein